MNIEEPSAPVILKPKSHAIPGLDYGIDMLDESPPTQQANANPEASGSEGSQHQSNGNFNFNQSQQQRFQPQRAPPPQAPRMAGGIQRPTFNFGKPANHFATEESMGDGSYGEESLGSNGSGSGSSMSMDDGSGQGLLSQGFQVPGSQSGSGSGAQAPELTYEQRRERKINALASLRRLEEAGYLPSGDKKFSFTSDLAEIEDTVERLKLQRDLDSSIKVQRKFLVGFANVVEFVCSTEYNIFDLKLEGWSDSIFENITDYDEVFEELYYKYKDSVAVMPEIKLVMMVGGSAMMFHMSRELFSKTSSKVPGFDEVMARDPDLRRKYTDVAAGIAKDRGMPMPSKADGGAGFLKDMMNNFKPGRSPSQQQQQQPQMQQRPNISRSRVPMNEPDDIDGLLGSLKAGRKSPDEIDLSEIENLSDLA
jgi:hypothetical protein